MCCYMGIQRRETSETWQEGRKPPSKKLIFDHPLNKELQCGTGETGERLGIESKGKGTTCCRRERSGSLCFLAGGSTKFTRQVHW